MTEADAQAPVEEKAPVEEEATRVPLSRREFLYYLWGISMAVLLSGAGGATIWFTLPRFKEGEFGGVFEIPVSDLPEADAGPQEFPEGRFWLVHIGSASLQDPREPDDYSLEQGIRAIYKVCTHLGCLYKWVSSYDQFECPCHGSKFLKTGTRIDGPARRNLDIFPIEVINEAGEVLARTEPMMLNNSVEGSPVSIPSGAVAMRIDTGRTIIGAPSSRRGGGM
jgi:cytochrome b6-f complex iron-sulfur subunit